MTRDKLTGLLYYDDFKMQAAELIKSLVEPCMLVSMNLSNFKYVNTVYGYEKGDRLLASVADYYFHNNEKCLLASRIHSDRFVAILKMDEGIAEENLTTHYEQVHKNFIRIIEKDYPLTVLRVNAGAYVLTDLQENISEILDKAEMARRYIMEDYTATVCFFTEVLAEKSRLEQSIIPLFERAIKDDTILVYLQPKIDVDSQQIVGAEALARMVDEKGKIISPAIFIPALEKVGMVTQLDMYVARKVFRMLNSWQARGFNPIPISLNLSRVDFKMTEEWAEIMEEMEKLAVPREYVEFEVTETVFFEDISVISKRVRSLREKGFRISMDDFGTGYSSLNVLGMLPLDCIKFDRGFVQHSINSRKGLEIMAGLVDIFEKIDLDVVCEGVETVEEEQIVRACGCKWVQGYLHDKPMPIPDFEAKYLVKAAG